MKDYGFSTPTHFMVLICCSCTQCWLTFLSEPTGEFFCTRKCQTSCSIQEKKKRKKMASYSKHCHSITFWFSFELHLIYWIFFLSTCLSVSACLYKYIFFLAVPELGFKCSLILWWYFMPVRQHKNANVLSGVVKWFAILSSTLAGAFDLATVPGE